MVAPSFVTVTSPMSSTSIYSRPIRSLAFKEGMFEGLHGAWCYLVQPHRAQTGADYVGHSADSCDVLRPNILS